MRRKICIYKCMFNVYKINKIGKQEVGIWRVQKRFPRYGVPIWSLWPNIRFLPLIVAEKNATKNEHICSMCIKNKQSRQTGSRNLTGPTTLPTIWHTYMKLVTKYQIPVVNSCLEKCMLNVYKNQQNRQTGSRNQLGPKNASHDMGYLYKACDQISDFCYQ